MPCESSVAAMLPRRPWQTRNAGVGAKGPRDYEWAWIAIDAHPHRWLLIRRNPTTGELAFYRCWAPHRADVKCKDYAAWTQAWTTIKE